MRSVLRIRLGTMLLLVVVFGMLIRLVFLKRDDARLMAEIAPLRNLKNEGLAEILDRPLALTYADGATLEQFLKDVKAARPASPSYQRVSPSTWIQSAFPKQTGRCSQPSEDRRRIKRSRYGSI